MNSKSCTSQQHGSSSLFEVHFVISHLLLSSRFLGAGVRTSDMKHLSSPNVVTQEISMHATRGAC